MLQLISRCQWCQWQCQHHHHRCGTTPHHTTLQQAFDESNRQPKHNRLLRVLLLQYATHMAHACITRAQSCGAAVCISATTYILSTKCDACHYALYVPHTQHCRSVHIYAAVLKSPVTKHLHTGRQRTRNLCAAAIVCFGGGCCIQQPHRHRVCSTYCTYHWIPSHHPWSQRPDSQCCCIQQALRHKCTLLYKLLPPAKCSGAL